MEAFDGKAKADSTSSAITFGDTWKRLDAGIQLRSGYNIKDIVENSKLDQKYHREMQEFIIHLIENYFYRRKTGGGTRND